MLAIVADAPDPPEAGDRPFRPIGRAETKRELDRLRAALNRLTKALRDEERSRRRRKLGDLEIAKRMLNEAVLGLHAPAIEALAVQQGVTRQDLRMINDPKSAEVHASAINGIDVSNVAYRGERERAGSSVPHPRIRKVDAIARMAAFHYQQITGEQPQRSIDRNSGQPRGASWSF